MASVTVTPGRWYSGISRYQCLALGLAPLGWVLDVFEGQIFVGSLNETTPALLGGEWAVASTLVAEEFPRRSRAWTQSLFQACGTLGKCLAAAAGVVIVAQPAFPIPLPPGAGTLQVHGWRLAFLLGAALALLLPFARETRGCELPD